MTLKKQTRLNADHSKALFAQTAVPPETTLGVLTGIDIWGQNPKMFLTMLQIQLPKSCQRFVVLRYLHMKQQAQ